MSARWLDSLDGGLTAVPDAPLGRALAMLRREATLAEPLTEQRLRAEGVAHACAVASSLHGLDPGAQARVIELVLAERAARRPPELRVVWTGPEDHTATASDSAVLLQQLLGNAQRNVLLAGFRFDHGERILAPLHEAMRTRGVSAMLFADVKRGDYDPRPFEQILSDFKTDLMTKTWSFGPPYPRVYYDPRQANPYVSLHAKCAVIDHTHTLITSANFTDRGLTRNIELGVHIEDPGFAERVHAQWMGLVRAGLVKECA